MHERLSKIIAYKTGGRQADFAAMLGWTPQYLAKLLKGGSFGLNPVLAILTAMPELDARWFLFGEGEMLTPEGVADVRQGIMSRVQSLISYEQYIPIMTADELREMEQAVKKGIPLQYSPDTLASMAERLTNRQNEMDARFRASTAKSNKSCKAKTVKK